MNTDRKGFFTSKQGTYQDPTTLYQIQITQENERILDAELPLLIDKGYIANNNDGLAANTSAVAASSHGDIGPSSSAGRAKGDYNDDNEEKDEKQSPSRDLNPGLPLSVLFGRHKGFFVCCC